MKVAACIPYRPRDEDRPLNFIATRQPYDQLGWGVFTGDHEGEIFCRSKAINAAAKLALAHHDPDVLFIADSDVLIPDLNQLTGVAELAHRDDCYVVAFSHLYVLDREGTEQARRSRVALPTEGEHVLETLALIWGSAFAIGRACWERTGGFDERFIGYGSEDLAFLPVANALGGSLKQRYYGNAWHLLHPENEERDHYAANAQLASQYRACDGDPDGIRAILEGRP